MSDRLVPLLGGSLPLQPFNGIHYTLNRSGCQVTDRDVCLVIAIEGTERDGETVGPPRMIFNAILDWWQWTPTKRQTSILFCQMVRFGWFG